jgi:hypothetical protein
MGQLLSMMQRLDAEALQRIEIMAGKTSIDQAAAGARLAQYAASLAVLPTRSYARILLQGQERIVLVVNTSNALFRTPGAPEEISLFFDSVDDQNGRILLKSHQPELLGDFQTFCGAPGRQAYYNAALKFAAIHDPIKVVRVVEHMQRNHMGADEASVWKAIEAVGRQPALPALDPRDFADRNCEGA